MSDNPKPLTYGAAMRALEGSQAALTEALAKLTTAVALVDRLRAFIDEYARHDDACLTQHPFHYEEERCSCGYRAARAALEEPKP